MTEKEPLLQVRHVSKAYGHIQALRDASLDVHAGEIVALLGDNGAGKSTLVSVISGGSTPDSGEVYFDGERLASGSVAAAAERGIAMVYQDLSLATDLDPALNVFLGREIVRGGLLGRLGVLDKKAMTRATTSSLKELRIQLQSVDQPVRDLSGGQRQAVAVARAMHWATRLLIMDEPTAALGSRQRELVMDLIVAAKEQGLAVLLISHDIPIILETVDRVTIMRRGRTQATLAAKETNVAEVVRLMVEEMAA